MNYFLLSTLADKQVVFRQFCGQFGLINYVNKSHYAYFLITISFNCKYSFKWPISGLYTIWSMFYPNQIMPYLQRVSKKKWDWLWCEKSNHSSSNPSSRMCWVIDYTLLIQVSLDCPLLFAMENNLCESCLKSSSQIWTFTMSSPEKKWDQCDVVQFCFLLRIQTYTLMNTLYGDNVLSHATIFHWHTFFTVGRTLAATLTRSSWPKCSAQILWWIWSWMVRELEAMFDNFCIGRFYQIVVNLRLN